MAVELNPKEHLRTLTPEHHKTFVELVANPAMRVGMSMSLAFMASTDTSAEELRGARKFMAILTTIGDPQEVQQNLPAKNLITIPN